MIMQLLPLIIILEILLSAFIVWGILNENKLIEFENQIIKRIIQGVKK